MLKNDAGVRVDGFPRAGRVLAVLALAAVVAAGLGLVASPIIRGEEPAADPAAATALEHANSLSRAFRHAAKIATPSVVVVRSEMKARPVGVERGRGRNPFEGTPFEDFFGDQMPEGFEFRGPMPPRRGGGVGSGVIVDAAGIVLTNNHVVEGADSVVVELSDGREFEAAEIKTDPDSDLAVVMLKGATNLPAATIGNSDELEIGDWVIAIGNPFELETTVSAGIISGKGRELGSIRRSKFLQTDAAINPGNSGGPLVNLRGEVVGINTAIASSNGGYQGIGFAIPANQAKWVSGQLIANGAVERGYMGVTISQLSSEIAERLGVPSKKGVLVTEVLPDSPAARGGVKELDVVVGFDGKPVDGPRTLQEVVERSQMDQTHTLEVIRDGKRVKLKVSVQRLPERFAARQPAGPRAAPSAREGLYDEELGLGVREQDAAARTAYAGFEGVVIDRVEPGSVAAAAGLSSGVLIRKVGRTPVTNVDEFQQALAGESLAEGVLLQVRTPRGNQIVILEGGS